MPSTSHVYFCTVGCTIFDSDSITVRDTKLLVEAVSGLLAASRSETASSNVLSSIPTSIVPVFGSSVLSALWSTLPPTAAQSGFIIGNDPWTVLDPELCAAIGSAIAIAQCPIRVGSASGPSHPNACRWFAVGASVGVLKFERAFVDLYDQCVRCRTNCSVGFAEHFSFPLSHGR